MFNAGWILIAWLLLLMLVFTFTQYSHAAIITSVDTSNSKQAFSALRDGRVFFDQIVSHVPTMNTANKVAARLPSLKPAVYDIDRQAALSSDEFRMSDLPSHRLSDIESKDELAPPVVVILVHLGYVLPEHVVDCVDQLKIWKGDARRQYRFIMVCNTNDVAHQASLIPNLEIYRYDYQRWSSEFNGASFSGKHHALFQWSLIRFHALMTCMKQWNIGSAIHIEHDNLIYAPLDDLFDLCQRSCGPKLGLTPDHMSRVIGGFTFVGSVQALEQFHEQCCEQKFSQIDMEALSTFLNRNPTWSYALPVMPAEWKNESYPKLNENARTFEVGIFDAAAAGQWIGGIDVIHSMEDTRGFVNETAMYQVHVQWTRDSRQRMVPVYSLQHNGRTLYYRFFNLHMHCKKLHRYLSLPQVPSTDIIQGERFRWLWHGDRNYGPYWMSFHVAEDFQAWSPPEEWPPIMACYVKGDLTDTFFQKIWPRIPQNVTLILITHNADFEVTEQYRSYLNDTKLRWWFGQNAQIKHPKLVALPIGLANSEWNHGQVDVLQRNCKTTFPFKKNVLYVNFTATHPDRAVIRQAIETAAKHGAPVWFDQNVDHETYLKNMSQCKFVACARGNGADTHRLWECIYTGGIPVIYEPALHKYDWLPSHMVPSLKPAQIEWSLPMKENFWHVGHGRAYWRFSYWKNRIQEHLRIGLSDVAKEQIDVLLLVHRKDLSTLPDCVSLLQENLWELRKIFIITAVPADEVRQLLYPVAAMDQIVVLDENDQSATGAPFTMSSVRDRMPDVGKRAGWYLQQLFKLHADLIPGVLPSILVMDSDTVLLKRVRFKSMDGKALFATGTSVHPPYSNHMQRVLPEVFQNHSNTSGIAHHMLFEASKLQDLRQQIERHWNNQGLVQRQCWQILLDHVKREDYGRSGCSEYEMYFHFMQKKYPDEMDTRQLWHIDVKEKHLYDRLLKERPCHMMSAHEWQRFFDRSVSDQ